jgi:hypothetical protein
VTAPAILTLDGAPAWVCWIAQDADGAWWGYEHAPNQAEHGWYENEVGRIIKLAQGPANDAWAASLRRVR